MSAAIETGDLPVTLGEVKAWLRMAASHDDPVLAGLIRTAGASCEAYTGQTLLSRNVTEILPARSGWQVLAKRPVTAITAVAVLNADGSTAALSPDAYAFDIDSAGDGWIRVDDGGGAGRIEVRYQAGMGTSTNAIPEALRQGIVRLVEYLFQTRDGTAAKPPAIVTALWQPWRRMRLGR